MSSNRSLINWKSLGGTGAGGVSEFLANDTSRANKAHTAFERDFRHMSFADRYPAVMYAAVQAAVSWGDKETVGGEVDEVVLSRDEHLHWVHRKPGCYMQDLAAPKARKHPTGNKQRKGGI